MLEGGETLPRSPAGRGKVGNLTEETREGRLPDGEGSRAERVTGQGVMESGHRAAE